MKLSVRSLERVQAKRLKAARINAGLSQRELLRLLADRVKVDVSLLSRYENGKIQPPVTFIYEVAQVLGLPEAHFYTADDDMAYSLFNEIPKNEQAEREKKHLISSYEERIFELQQNLVTSVKLLQKQVGVLETARGSAMRLARESLDLIKTDLAEEQKLHENEKKDAKPEE